MGDPINSNDANAKHTYVHHDNINGVIVNMKVEKNSKGYNWEVGVSNANSVAQALEVLKDAEEKMKAIYGSQG